VKGACIFIAPLEVSRATAWRWFALAYLSTQPSAVYLSVILMHAGLASPMTLLS
jgi:hypothetical protein